MENFSLLCYFLGIEVSYSSREYLCSQQKYISYILVSATISGPHVSYSPSLSVIKAKFDASSRWWGSFNTTHTLEKMCCCPYLFATHPDIFLMRYMYGVSLLVSYIDILCGFPLCHPLSFRTMTLSLLFPLDSPTYPSSLFRCWLGEWFRYLSFLHWILHFSSIITILAL